jgi:hypothetical protein
MKSMSQALLWEMSRHWYWLVIGFFAAALFPFLSLFSLRSLGIPPESPEMIRIHAFLMTFHFLIFFFGVIGTQGPIQRLYSYPLSNATIACWSMFSGIGLMFSGVAIMLLWFNVQFQASWPVLGPALIAIALSLFTFVVISIVKIDLVSGLWQSSFAGWYWLGLFFIPWAAMGCSATVCLFGRVPLVVAVTAALVGVIVLVAIPSTQAWCILSVSIASVLVVLAALAIGCRNGLLSTETITAAVAGWISLLVLSCLSSPMELTNWIVSWLVLLATVAILPIIVMPVAIAFNRHR